MAEGASTTEAPECTECGACCFFPVPAHVALTPGDMALLTAAEQRELTVFLGDLDFMRMKGDRCVNLIVGVKDPSGKARFTCAIYERRPMVCDAFERGSEDCADDRRRRYGALGRPLPRSESGP